MRLSQATRQLIVSSAFAAMNHGLTLQVERSIAAFPELIPETETRAFCQALLLFGLAQPAAALRCITTFITPEAEQLRQLIIEAHPELAKVTIADATESASLTRFLREAGGIPRVTSAQYSADSRASSEALPVEVAIGRSNKGV